MSGDGGPGPMIDLDAQRRFLHRETAKIGRCLGLGDLASFVAELDDDQAIKPALEDKVADVAFFRTKHWDSLLRLGLYRVAQYAIGRALGARAVVETGVLHGLSTLFSLAALERNVDADVDADGRIISIDLPSRFEDGPSNQDGFTDTLPPGLEPGWAIPDALRRRWNLRLGPSSEQLAPVLQELGGIDVFIHDSDHTYGTMTYEFETIWPALREGGVLIADNIDVNTSFFDFAGAVRRQPHVLPVDPDHVLPGGSGIRFGLLRK